MKAHEKFSPEMLYRLRKSDIELIREILDSDDSGQSASYLTKSFVDLLKQIKNINEAELDHITGLSAQLAMTNLWNDESICSFANYALGHLQQPVINAVFDGLDDEITKNMKNAFTGLYDIRKDLIENDGAKRNRELVVRLRKNSNKMFGEVVVINKRSGRLVEKLGSYNGSVMTGIVKVEIDNERLSKVRLKKPDFTNAAIELVAQGVYMVKSKIKK